MEKIKNSENSEKQNDRKSKNEGPENRMAESRHEKPLPNKNFDQAQRRQQAGSKSYNKNLGRENIENQNTLANQEQTSIHEGVEPKDQNIKKRQGKLFGRR